LTTKPERKCEASAAKVIAIKFRIFFFEASLIFIKERETFLTIQPSQ
jgi:hypothetical protein